MPWGIGLHIIFDPFFRHTPSVVGPFSHSDFRSCPSQGQNVPLTLVSDSLSLSVIIPYYGVPHHRVPRYTPPRLLPGNGSC